MTVGEEMEAEKSMGLITGAVGINYCRQEPRKLNRLSSWKVVRRFSFYATCLAVLYTLIYLNGTKETSSSSSLISIKLTNFNSCRRSYLR